MQNLGITTLRHSLYQGSTMCCHLAGPHPVLRQLLHTDAAVTLGILDESLAGWDALDADLRAAAGLPTVEDGAGRSATQVCRACISGHYLIALIGRAHRFRKHRLRRDKVSSC